MKELHACYLVRKTKNCQNCSMKNASPSNYEKHVQCKAGQLQLKKLSRIGDRKKENS